MTGKLPLLFKRSGLVPLAVRASNGRLLEPPLQAFGCSSESFASLSVESLPGLVPLAGLFLALIFATTVPLSYGNEAFAQAGVPLPGSAQGRPPTAPSAPVPGANPAGSMPGNSRQTGRPASPYQQLPLSAADAQTRIDELKSLAPEARPQEMQEAVMQLCEWLTEMAEAHFKLAASFAKSDATRAQSEAERQAGHKFSQLKNQALLVKADLLIRQQRYPEALAPLVDIVVQEPRSSTGQAAYKRLKEIGFAQEPEVKQEVKPETGPPQSAATEPPAVLPPVKSNTTKPAIAARPPVKPASKLLAVAPAKNRHPAVQAVSSKKGRAAWINGSPFGAGRSVASHHSGTAHR